MHPGRIAGFTRELNKPRDWDDSKGSCGSLPILDCEVAGCHAMVSAWLPTAEEIAAIVAGAPVYLTVVSYVHPPVKLSVGQAPAD